MLETTKAEFINKEELIYWIDKDFVQQIAQERVGRSLNDEEISHLTKMIEFGLWDAVNTAVGTAIDELNRGLN